MHIVFDTNVVISGLIWSGAPRDALQLAEKGDVQAIASETLIDELRSVLQRTKFEKHLKRRNATPSGLVSLYLSYTQIIEPDVLPLDIVRDIKDVMVLEAAVGGNAACVVTGDDDLLTLKTYQNIRILTVTDFLNMLSSENDTSQ